MRAGMLRGCSKCPESASVRGPGDEGSFGLDRLQSDLHPPDQIFHPPIGPVLVFAERGVVEVTVRNLLARVGPIVLPRSWQ